MGGRRKCPSSCETWEWVTSAPWTWENWASGQPDNEEEKCLEIFGGTYRSPFEDEAFLKWNDLNCSYKREFLCKMAK